MRRRGFALWPTEKELRSEEHAPVPGEGIAGPESWGSLSPLPLAEEPGTRPASKPGNRGCGPANMKQRLRVTLLSTRHITVYTSVITAIALTREHLPQAMDCSPELSFHGFRFHSNPAWRYRLSPFCKWEYRHRELQTLVWGYTANKRWGRLLPKFVLGSAMLAFCRRVSLEVWNRLRNCES